MASKGLITKTYQDMTKQIESSPLETPQQPLLAIHGVSGSYFPKCNYCGQFVNPNKGGVKMGVQYGFMGIDYDYYYHEKCARGTERL